MERALEEYEEALDVAIAFADHVARERRVTRRRRGWVLLSALSISLPFVFLLRQTVIDAKSHASARWCSKSCMSDGRCMASWSALWSREPPVCLMGPQDDCDTVCADHGACEVRNSRCVAARQEDCTQSWDCRYQGRCSLEQGQCVPANDAECAASQQCKLAGSCWLVDGECVARSDDDCVAASSCAGWDVCKLDFATSSCHFEALPDSCTDQSDCYQHGRCTHAPDGDCVAASDADCERGTDCDFYGHCRQKGGECVIMTDEDCRRSRDCSRHGRCVAKQGRCVSTAVGVSALDFGDFRLQ